MKLVDELKKRLEKSSYKEEPKDLDKEEKVKLSEDALETVSGGVA